MHAHTNTRTYTRVFKRCEFNSTLRTIQSIFNNAWLENRISLRVRKDCRLSVRTHKHRRYREHNVSTYVLRSMTEMETVPAMRTKAAPTSSFSRANVSPAFKVFMLLVCGIRVGVSSNHLLYESIK